MLKRSDVTDNLVSSVDRMLDCITADIVFTGSASTPKIAYCASDDVDCQDCESRSQHDN